MIDATTDLLCRCPALPLHAKAVTAYLRTGEGLAAAAEVTAKLTGLDRAESEQALAGVRAALIA